MKTVARTPAVRDDRRHLTTIMTAFQPIENYRSDDPSAPVSCINPLDFYVIDLLLELIHDTATVLDLTAPYGEGEPAVATLQHPNVRKTILVGASAQLRERIHDFAVRSGSAMPADSEKLSVVDSLDELPIDNRPLRRVVWIQFDTRDADAFPPLLTKVLARFPHSVILLTGLGAVGLCRGITTALQLRDEKTHRFRLARELVEVFGQSTLGIISQDNDASLEQALSRIQRLHNGNLDYLRLLRVTNSYAMEAASVPDPSSGEARSFLELNAKISKQSRAAMELEIETLRAQLAAAAAERAATRLPFDPIVTSMAYRLALRLQRLRHKLAPPSSVRFKIYRGGIKVARSIIWRPLRWLRQTAKLAIARR
jgi:hypothetical protein